MYYRQFKAYWSTKSMSNFWCFLVFLDCPITPNEITVKSKFSVSYGSAGQFCYSICGNITFSCIEEQAGLILDDINKKELSEIDICDLFITPAIKDAGWDQMTQIRREVPSLQGRLLSGAICLRLPPFLNHQLVILRWNLQFLFTATDKSVRHYFHTTSLYKYRVMLLSFYSLGG